jgi:hypothetical protein
LRTVHRPAIGPLSPSIPNLGEPEVVTGLGIGLVLAWDLN